MRIVVRHEMVFRFEAPARYSIQYLRLTPRADASQRVFEWRIDTPGRQWRQTDAYGNVIVVFSLDQRHREIRLAAQGTVETFFVPGAPIPNVSPLPPEAFLVPTALTRGDEESRSIAGTALEAGREGKKVLDTMMAGLRDRMASRIGEAHSVAGAAETLWQGAGTAQDQAHVFLACARAAGLPARYVSGYLASEVDRVSVHAWVDVWIAGQGWISVDPTYRTYPGESYCRLAVGRDALDAAPVRGARPGFDGRSTITASTHDTPHAAEQ